MNVITDIGKFAGMCNVGNRPTFNDPNKKTIVEVHLISNKNFNLYGKNIKIEFIKFIRREKKYSNTSMLIEQLHHDKVVCSI